MLHSLSLIHGGNCSWEELLLTERSTPRQRAEITRVKEWKWHNTTIRSSSSNSSPSGRTRHADVKSSRCRQVSTFSPLLLLRRHNFLFFFIKKIISFIFFSIIKGNCSHVAAVKHQCYVGFVCGNSHYWTSSNCNYQSLKQEWYFWIVCLDFAFALRGRRYKEGTFVLVLTG